MVRFVTITRFSADSGYTENAIRSKIRDDIWREGQEWHRAPDGRVLIDREGYDKWVEKGLGLLPPPKRAYKSHSNIGANVAGKRLPSSPPPLI